MASLKGLLRSGRTIWFAAALAVACSPAAASTTSEEVIIAPSESSDSAQDASTGDAPTDVHSADPIADGTAGTAAAAPASSTQDLVTSEQDGTSQVAVASNDVVRPAGGAPATTDNSTTAGTLSGPQAADATTSATITTTVGVSAGGEATVTANASPNVACAITVSGAGRAPGLDAKQTDTTGKVTWTWTDAAGTPTSSWAARVECSHSESIDVAPTTTDRSDEPERTLQRETRGPREVHEKDLERRSGPRN